VEFADINQAAPHLQMGVKHFCIGREVRILHDWWRVNGEGMRAMVPAVRGLPKSCAYRLPS
jgi:4-hydroxy-2-oxoheptanedioate aldolase